MIIPNKSIGCRVRAAVGIEWYEFTVHRGGNPSKIEGISKDLITRFELTQMGQKIDLRRKRGLG